MGSPSKPFLILGGIMIILFIVGLVLIAVLATRDNTPVPLMETPIVEETPTPQP